MKKDKRTKVDNLPGTLYLLTEFDGVTQVVRLDRVAPPDEFLAEIHRWFGEGAAQWCTHYGKGLLATFDDERHLYLGAPKGHCQLWGYSGCIDDDGYWHVDSSEYYLDWSTQLDAVFIPWMRRLQAQEHTLKERQRGAHQRAHLEALAIARLANLLRQEDQG